jgi:hypothetical protein
VEKVISSELLFLEKSRNLHKIIKFSS